MYLLKADISHFYPSLYTHAIGWAIDPKLRLKANWNNKKLLGRQIDQLLMDSDGKISQGIPIGNDISFLLAEIVLTQIDKSVGVAPERSFRCYDDYEFAFSSRVGAEAALSRLTKGLGQFRLRLNPLKTKIVQLPRPSEDEWQQTLHKAGKSQFRTPRQMVQYFDCAFLLREQRPDSAVLSYALGILFRLKCPEPEVGQVAVSCITQAVLCEPGSAQKVFALISFWKLNGFTLDEKLITQTVNQIVLNHRATGVSSDVAWALAFCLDHQLELSGETGKILSSSDDDCIALQALHLHSTGLLPRGFNKKEISKIVTGANLDREHWLLAYESVRQGFLTSAERSIKKHALFSKLLGGRVTFYRNRLPAYASIIHPGGAPSWLVRSWVDALKKAPNNQATAGLAITEMLGRDFERLKQKQGSRDVVIVGLLGTLEQEFFPALVDEPYS